MTGFGKGLGVPNDPIIPRVNRVTDHCDAARPPVPGEGRETAHVPGYFPGECMPESPGVAFRHVRKQTFIMFDRERADGRRLVRRPQVIRMQIDQCHPSVLCDPVEFAQPNLRGIVLQKEKKRRILDQRVGQLHVTPARSL